MSDETTKLVIESVKEDGRAFRPSDWIERISSALGSFGTDHRLHYAKGVQPRSINGEKCLVVDESLKTEDPVAYEYIVNFAASNGLRVHHER
ncbi:MAG: DUF3579 domain-containing protein [Gammaproteobacteria bacterium]|nr:DUF3579 domain-containing protein [Gammaproteobacteria bacterium]